MQPFRRLNMDDNLDCRYHVFFLWFFVENIPTCTCLFICLRCVGFDVCEQVKSVSFVRTGNLCFLQILISIKFNGSKNTSIGSGSFPTVKMGFSEAAMFAVGAAPCSFSVMLGMARHSASPRKRKFSPVPIFRTISFVIKLYTCFFEGYFGK